MRSAALVEALVRVLAAAFGLQHDAGVEMDRRSRS